MTEKRKCLGPTEIILLKVPMRSGCEYVDAHIRTGASYQEIADEATKHEAIAILRFDESRLAAEDITDTISVMAYADLSNPPLWLQNSKYFSLMQAEEIEDAKLIAAHERAFLNAA